MSGVSLDDAIVFDDDEGELSKCDLDVQQYDSESVVDGDDDDAPIYITDSDEEGDLIQSCRFHPPTEAAPKTFEVPAYEIYNGVVRPGTVVELKDDSGRTSNSLLSGDFLLVRKIIETLEAEEVVLHGYRLRRVEYLVPIFDKKLNDLFMLITIKENEERPRSEQGLEEIHSDEVLRIRTCIFTSMTYDQLSLNKVNPQIPQAVFDQGRAEVRKWLFKRGNLICRWVHVVHLDHNGKSYAGEARRMYKREADAYTLESSELGPPASSTIGANAHSRSGTSRKRAVSLEEITDCQFKRQQPQKRRILTLGDGFCGIGGVSEGARQAGWKVVWGLELDDDAIVGYISNHPGAMHIQLNAHDFPKKVVRGRHGCDHVHMSCPCCFWSEAHTVDGQNDQANMETIFTVQPWLVKLKPYTFSLEQAPGLLKLKKHKMYFRSLLNGILTAGYGVRWKVQDQAWFGIAQHRRRLIFVGAKNGVPLPPFPSPQHGPPGSGLKRYVTIKDALMPLERHPHAFRRDPYHQPQDLKPVNGEKLNPDTHLAKCITTSGGENVHYSGARPYTVRELSLFQGFPPTYHFTGPISTAKTQAGNAWPVTANKAHFTLWAAFLEAYHAGLIDPEDEVHDLYDFLEQKGVRIPKPEPIDVDMFNSSSSGTRTQTQIPAKEPEYRYLHKIEKTVKPRVPLQLWGRRKEIEARPQRRRKERAGEGYDFSGTVVRSGDERGRDRRLSRRTTYVVDEEGNIVID